MTSILEASTTLKSRDLNKMLLVAMFFSNKLILPLILILALVAALLNRRILGFTGSISLVFFWLFFLAIIILLILRRARSMNRARGSLGYLNKPQYYRFYQDYLAYQPAGADEFIDIAYKSIEKIERALGLVIIRVLGNQYLIIKEKDLQGRTREIVDLIRSQAAN